MVIKVALHKSDGVSPFLSPYVAFGARAIRADYRVDYGPQIFWAKVTYWPDNKSVIVHAIQGDEAPRKCRETSTRYKLMHDAVVEHVKKTGDDLNKMIPGWSHK